MCGPSNAVAAVRGRATNNTHLCFKLFLRRREFVFVRVALLHQCVVARSDGGSTFFGKFGQ